MRRTVPPSAVIEGQIDELLAVGVGDNPRESLSELARLGARLIIQRAVGARYRRTASVLGVRLTIGQRHVLGKRRAIRAAPGGETSRRPYCVASAPETWLVIAYPTPRCPVSRARWAWASRRWSRRATNDQP